MIGPSESGGLPGKPAAFFLELMMHNKYAKPACLKNAKGQVRRVGFELEFAGLDLKTAATVLAQAVRGSVEEDTQAECKVKHPDWGDFKIELDWQFGKTLARRRLEEKDGVENATEDAILGLLTDVARQIVPLEVVCPPVPADQLVTLDPMVSALRSAGALGTSDSLIYAFGLHINTEIPDFDSATLVAYLKAYCVAQNWLVKAHRVDMLRRLTPYIDPYPKRYMQTVMGYSPDTPVQQIMDDYLAHNPTRNRGLDLLPLFKHMDPDRVLAAVHDERVNARPTFHYRLPNCEIEQPDWGLTESWNIWCMVEYLAATPAVLKSMCEQWTAYDQNLINLQEEPWHTELTQIHGELLSA